MPSANQPLDTVLLKTGVASSPTDGLGKVASDSNISKNSFNDVYNQERASSNETQQTDALEAPAEAKNSANGSDDAVRAALHEDTAEPADGNESTKNGKTLPYAEDSDQYDVQTKLVVLQDDSERSPDDQQLSVDSGEDSDGQQNAVLLGDADVLDAQQATSSEEESIPTVAAFNSQDEAKPGSRMSSDIEASIVKKASAEQGKATPALQTNADDSTTGTAKTQALAADDSKLGEERFETNFKALKAGESDKQSVGVEKIKIAQAQASSVLQPESAETLKQQTRVDGAQLAQQMSVAAKLEAGSSQIQVAMNSPNWGQAVAQRVLMMAKAGVQAAQLQLHPRELGPVEVRISMVNEQAQVQFSSQYSVVRESLESSLPRLREMFDGSNLELLDVNVSDQTLAERDANTGEGGEKRSSTGELEELEPLLAHSELETQARGLVDYYA